MMSQSCPFHCFQLPLQSLMSASFSMYVPFLRCEPFPCISRRADWFPGAVSPFHSPCTPLFISFSLCPFQFLGPPPLILGGRVHLRRQKEVGYQLLPTSNYWRTFFCLWGHHVVPVLLMTLGVSLFARMPRDRWSRVLPPCCASPPPHNPKRCGSCGLGFFGAWGLSLQVALRCVVFGAWDIFGIELSYAR